jgi:hypothetical protein
MYLRIASTLAAASCEISAESKVRYYPSVPAAEESRRLGWEMPWHKRMRTGPRDVDGPEADHRVGYSLSTRLEQTSGRQLRRTRDETHAILGMLKGSKFSQR